MKKSNVSFENLLDQLSEDKINRVVERGALRAGGLELLTGGSGGQASSTGSNHTNTHSSTTSSANCGCGGGLFGTGL